MPTNTLQTFSCDEWFLGEKSLIATTRSPLVSSSISIEEWSAKAKSILSKHIAEAAESPLEKALIRDAIGALVLDMMRSLEPPFFILREIFKNFEIQYSEEWLAEYMRLKFVDAYELYLKRIYLMEKGEMILDSLIKNYGKNSSEQFLYFVSNYKTCSLSIGVDVRDFEFVINTACQFWHPSMMDQAAEKLEKGV